MKVHTFASAVAAPACTIAFLLACAGCANNDRSYARNNDDRSNTRMERSADQQTSGYYDGQTRSDSYRTARYDERRADGRYIDDRYNDQYRSSDQARYSGNRQDSIYRDGTYRDGVYYNTSNMPEDTARRDGGTVTTGSTTTWNGDGTSTSRTASANQTYNQPYDASRSSQSNWDRSSTDQRGALSPLPTRSGPNTKGEGVVMSPEAQRQLTDNPLEARRDEARPYAYTTQRDYNNYNGSRNDYTDRGNVTTSTTRTTLNPSGEGVAQSPEARNQPTDNHPANHNTPADTRTPSTTYRDQNGVAMSPEARRQPTDNPTEMQRRDADKAFVTAANRDRDIKSDWALSAATSDAEILAAVMAVDLNEIVAASIAKQEVLDSRATGYAKMMKEMHGKHLFDTMKLSSKLGIEPSCTAMVETIEKKGVDALTTLARLDGDEFQTAYVRSAIKCHTEALAMIDQNLMKAAKSNEVRQHLVEMRVIVADHLEKAKALSKASSSALTDAKTQEK